MRFILIILTIFVASSLCGQQVGKRENTIGKVMHHHLMPYWYKSSSGRIDTLKVAGDSSEYIILYMTSDAIEVINRNFFDLLNKDALYSLLDVRPYDSTGNPFLEVDVEQLHGAFTQAFTKKECMDMQQDLKKYLRSVDFGVSDWMAEKDGTNKYTINDWLTLYGRDFFNIFIGIDCTNEVKLIKFKFQNIEFFRNLNPDRLLELEQNILKRVIFKPLVPPPPDNKMNLYLLSLDLNKLKNYYKNN